jgi:sugar (pentulose or hexulose) kinase
LGAAIDAAVGVGLQPDFSSAIKDMTRLGRTFEPDQSLHTLYNRYYHEVYLKMYRRLRPLYEAIQDIERPLN